jgi:hypothetical protein
LLGSLVAEFGDSALNVLWTGETWWAGLAAWLNAEPGSAIYTMARLQMAQPLLDLFSAVVFTGVIVAGRVAWPRRPA